MLAQARPSAVVELVPDSEFEPVATSALQVILCAATCCRLQGIPIMQIGMTGFLNGGRSPLGCKTCRIS